MQSSQGTSWGPHSPLSSSQPSPCSRFSSSGRWRFAPQWLEPNSINPSRHGSSQSALGSLHTGPCSLPDEVSFPEPSHHLPFSSEPQHFPKSSLRDIVLGYPAPLQAEGKGGGQPSSLSATLSEYWPSRNGCHVCSSPERTVSRREEKLGEPPPNPCRHTLKSYGLI